MKNDKVLQMLGLAARGRKIESGEFSTEKAVKAGKAGLVIVAKDASDNTKKLFRNMCAFYEVPYYEYAVKEDVSENSIGLPLQLPIADLQKR